LAWLAWLFVHLTHLIEFQNKILVLVQWGWYYFSRNRAARLIVGETSGRAVRGDDAQGRKTSSPSLIEKS
jgi:NADH dehydrogenase